jgi:hypothetical protein
MNIFFKLYCFVNPFRFMVLILFTFILSCSVNSKELNLKLLKNGDLIFQETLGEQAEALKMLTKSRYTHVGIIIFKDKNIYVFEARAGEIDFIKRFYK